MPLLSLSDKKQEREGKKKKKIKPVSVEQGVIHRK